MLKTSVLITYILFSVASASAQTPFYQGKLLTIVVATKAGDVYDLYPRLLAEIHS